MAGVVVKHLQRVEAQREQLDQQVQALLSAVEAVRSAPSETASWQPEADLYKLADQVRKEREDARKYEVPVVAGCGHPVHACTCSPKNAAMMGRVVTAIDARDVEPLTETLAQVLGTCQEVAHEVEDKTQAVGEIEALTRNALKAFEDEEGSG